MSTLFDHPFIILPASLLLFWLSCWVGSWFCAQQVIIREERRDDITFVLGSTLTLLGLIVGFTFSMAVSRYDQRKTYEEEEANAIGTEYVRADLLPVNNARAVHILLAQYLNQRILCYTTSNEQQLRTINAQTNLLQNAMWFAVTGFATERDTPVIALIVSGMNDVLNSQGYTQAAWQNRIPLAAWTLLAVISIFCNVLVGYRVHGRSTFVFLVLPIALSISLFLIADIDSPYHGVIRVQPQNLEQLAVSLRSR